MKSRARRILSREARPAEVAARFATRRAALGYPFAIGFEMFQRPYQGVRPRLVLLDLSMPMMDGWAFPDEIQGSAFAHSALRHLVRCRPGGQAQPSGCFGVPFKSQSASLICCKPCSACRNIPRPPLCKSTDVRLPYYVRSRVASSGRAIPAIAERYAPAPSRAVASARRISPNVIGPLKNDSAHLGFSIAVFGVA